MVLCTKIRYNFTILIVQTQCNNNCKWLHCATTQNGDVFKWLQFHKNVSQVHNTPPNPKSLLCRRAANERRIVVLPTAIEFLRSDQIGLTFYELFKTFKLISEMFIAVSFWWNWLSWKHFKLRNFYIEDKNIRRGLDSWITWTVLSVLCWLQVDSLWIGIGIRNR